MSTTPRTDAADTAALLEKYKCPFTGISRDGGKTFPPYSVEEKIQLLCMCCNDNDDGVAEVRVKNAELERENARLREALLNLGLDYYSVPFEDWPEHLQALLAQPLKSTP
jgi:hypothetical protein